MILERIEHPDGTVSFDGKGFHLAGLHPAEPACYEHGCVVHSPSPNARANREDWPYHWRSDRTPPIMERLCPHGIGMPDPDAADYNRRIGKAYLNIHGSCPEGCSAS